LIAVRSSHTELGLSYAEICLSLVYICGSPVNAAAVLALGLMASNRLRATRGQGSARTSATRRRTPAPQAHSKADEQMGQLQPQRRQMARRAGTRNVIELAPALRFERRVAQPWAAGVSPLISPEPVRRWGPGAGRLCDRTCWLAGVAMAAVCNPPRAVGAGDPHGRVMAVEVPASLRTVPCPASSSPAQILLADAAPVCVK
jgi:hypothetical protein